MKISNQYYIDIVISQEEQMCKLYNNFEDKRPVMLFDIQEQRGYAYPYEDFKSSLSKRSQAMLAKEYKEALANNEMVIFVRDNENKKFVSMSIPWR